MRLGGNIDTPYNNPDEWITHVKDLDYSCVLSPVPKTGSSADEIQRYLDAAAEHDIHIGEVGIWNNPLSPDPMVRKKALDYSISRLDLADKLGANCCVNVAGAPGENFVGLYAENYSEETYRLLVENTRTVIDSVKPGNTFFCIEPMPWMTPDSPESYLRLLEDVGRDKFAVHLDFVNFINTPRKFAFRQDFIAECFEKLSPYTKSIHLKDARLRDGVSFMMEECPPGEGELDFVPILKMCEEMGENTTVFVEHMIKPEEYKKAVQHIRRIAETAGVLIKRCQ